MRAGSNSNGDAAAAWDPAKRSPFDFHHGARPARRHSLAPPSSSTSASSSAVAAAAMYAWKNSRQPLGEDMYAATSNQHQREGTRMDGSKASESLSPFAYPPHSVLPPRHYDNPHSDDVRTPESTGMKFILRQGQMQARKNNGQSPYPHPNGLLKQAARSTGGGNQHGNQVQNRAAHSPHLVQLPEGTLHVWVYQARHLVFRRLFETMYERHGLRLRVYVGSKSTQDVGEIYETRRNYGGNMANPRWRRDQDDARDNTHGHFSIPLSRPSLRSDTELTLEIVCGILVVASTKISLPALFLGSFGTDLASLATRNMQFRPHWFPLAGEESGLIEMSLEFIPTKLVQQNQQLQFSNQPESEYDEYDGQYEDEDASPFLHEPTRPTRSASNSPEKMREAELDRQRAREYEALERQEELRRQRFQVLDDHGRGRSGTTTSSHSTTSSSQSNPRFVIPRRSSLSELETRSYGQEEYLNQEDVVIMDAYESSPPPSEFSGYEHHDSRYDEEDNYSSGYEDRSSSVSSDFDALSLSASSSWASISTLNDSTVNTQENLVNKQLWDLYRYGISDEAPEEITAYSVSPRSSMVSISSSVLSRKMSTMSQASNYSVAFSDASEASMMSREASTCASEILTYNDRIQRMEEAIRAAQDRRLAEEASAVASASITATQRQQQPSPPQQQQQQLPAQAPRGKMNIPPSISTSHNNNSNNAPPRQPAPLTPYGWERPQSTPPSSEPAVIEHRKGVVLFDLDDIPVKGQSGQTDPALAAYRAKMLARRRSLPIHMLSGPGMNGLAGVGDRQPHGVMRDGRLVRMNSQPRPSTADGMDSQWSTRTLQLHPPAVVGTSVRRSSQVYYPPHKSDDSVHSGRPSDAARSSKSDESNKAAAVPGPPSLRRKRSSSMHSISDLLRDQSFRIHNIATGPTSTTSSSRHSIADHRSTMSDRRLSKASSSSDASSNGPQVVPTVSATSAVPRVRRNSKGGGNVVQINGIALGVGKFINVGSVAGVIRYIGPTMFAPGQWIGIELVERKGKHNGTVQNVQYFECAPEHGIFIRAERLDISS